MRPRKEAGETNVNEFRRSSALPLSSLHHISRVCQSLAESTNFYEKVLGFVQIRRPASLGVEGSWLFNYGIEIHLLQSKRRDSSKVGEAQIDPKSDHISFLCEDIELVEEKLVENGIKYVRREVRDGGIYVDQIFFHDPDGFMIEVCTCDKFPVIPLTSMRSNSNSPARGSSNLATSMTEISVRSILSGAWAHDAGIQIC